MGRKQLTDSTIQKTLRRATPYKITDAKGLFIQIQPTGAKLWRYRYRINGKENVFAMGEYAQPIRGETESAAKVRRGGCQFTLEEARQQRIAARNLVRQGVHPAQHRQSTRAILQVENVNTFEAAALDWLTEKAAKWTPGHTEQVRRVLKAYVFPKIGSRPIRQDPGGFAAEILAIMRQVEKKAPVTARNIRQYASAVFCFAVRNLRADVDPTSVLKGVVERPAVKHKTPMPKEQIPQFVAKIDKSNLYPTTRIGLRLLLFLFVRPSELRKAEWTEFSLDDAEWRIPAARMKKRELHVVPLPDQAIKLLRELHAISGRGKYLFPGRRNPSTCMNGASFNTALRTLGYANQFSAHGFRATASSILHEMGHPSALIELCLAHKERDETMASYNQYEYIKERRALMEQWAGYVDSLIAGGKVSHIRRAA